MSRARTMPPPFGESANSVFWLAIGGVAVIVLAIPAFAIAWARTPYATGTGEPVDQPIPFDHRHHVRDDGIDCLFCHADAMRSSRAGMPSTARCMGCHAQIRTTSPKLAPVRESWFRGEPIRWRRVTTMPDHVFFDHSVHTNHGIECVRCHGRVDEMARVFAPAPLTMEWCLDCHRDEARTLDDCSRCHR